MASLPTTRFYYVGKMWYYMGLNIFGSQTDVRYKPRAYINYFLFVYAVLGYSTQIPSLVNMDKIDDHIHDIAILLTISYMYFTWISATLYREEYAEIITFWMQDLSKPYLHEDTAKKIISKGIRSERMVTKLILYLFATSASSQILAPLATFQVFQEGNRTLINYTLPLHNWTPFDRMVPWQLFIDQVFLTALVLTATYVSIVTTIYFIIIIIHAANNLELLNAAILSLKVELEKREEQSGKLSGSQSYNGDSGMSCNLDGMLDLKDYEEDTALNNDEFKSKMSYLQKCAETKLYELLAIHQAVLE
ncbi:uncharacterized protein LOC134542134 [Bacillus rossius redtenbacheri]|uniref:uncharacterized protein LOC134542134 n=1 Tax=Bacillus rossius redtenbacheri TaxID=93214 RepID=UPI002FDECCB6